MIEESELSPQEDFLIAIGGPLMEEDNILLLVKDVLADLSAEKCALLKLKFGLVGGYTTYSDAELAAILRKDIEELRRSLRKAMTAARAAFRLRKARS